MQVQTMKDIIEKHSTLLLDNSKIKVIDGIAGAGKSSALHKFLTDNKISYLRTTSTNKLRRDAMSRFPECRCTTTCSGLFITDKRDGGYYAKPKEHVEEDTIVIDEILQTSSKVLDWCLDNVGKKNIIITTDSHQMLAVGQSLFLLSKYKEFCQNENVAYFEVMTTLRARDEITSKIFYELYNSVEDESVNMFEKYSKILPKIPWEQMKFSINNIYLFHDNQAEDKWYRRFDITNNALLEKVAKGHIANKDDYDETKYNCLSQLQANRLKVSSYFQAANGASVVRFQGSEIRDDQVGYFIVRPGSKVSNREFYTAVTRCWNVKSFIIVILKEKKKTQLTTFYTCPIKKVFYYRVEGDVKLNEDGTVPVDTVLNAIKGKDTDEVAYRTDGLEINGKIVRTTVAGERTKFSARKILKDSPELYYSQIEEIYKVLNDNYIERIHFANKFAGNENKKKEEFEHQEDLFSAYPHFLEYCKMPVDGEIYFEEDSDKLNFYLIDCPDLFEKGTIITDNLKNLIEQNIEERQYSCEYLFSLDYGIGHKASQEILKAAYDTKESKSNTKKIRWGFFLKPYIKVDWCTKMTSKGEEIEIKRAIRQTENVYEPLMIQIFSEMSYIQLSIRKEIYGTIFKGGRVCVDAFFYDGDHEDDVKRVLEEKLKEFHLAYRIYRRVGTKWNKDKDEVLYRNYDEPISKWQKWYRKKKTEQQ